MSFILNGLFGGAFFYVALLAELARREKQAGVFPEEEIDLFMKVSIVPLTCSEKSWICSNELLGTVFVTVNLFLKLYSCLFFAGNSNGRYGE